MDFLSWCWRGSRRQALRDLRKGLVGSSEGGNTGRRTDWPCHTNSPDRRLLGPSVQLPAGIHGCAPYKDFGRNGKGKRRPLETLRPWCLTHDEDGAILKIWKTTPCTERPG